jgi:hypothetical protein
MKGLLWNSYNVLYFHFNKFVLLNELSEKLCLIFINVRVTETRTTRIDLSVRCDGSACAVKLINGPSKRILMLIYVD